MNKNRILEELTTLLAISLRHRIGGIVNKNEIYAQRYAKDSEILFKQAEKVKEQITWNYGDKIEIREKLKIKLKIELEKKDFLSDEKYNLIDSEIEKALKDLGIL